MMKTILAVLISSFTLANCLVNDVKSPGMSMSLDLSLITQFKDTHMNTIIQNFNGMQIADIDLGADGHVNSNQIYVKVRNYDIQLLANGTANSYTFRMKNLYFFIRSKDFKYNMWFVPIKASLDIEVGQVNLDFELVLGNTTVQWLNPSLVYETRVVPQISIPRADLVIDPKRMKFNIGGSVVAQVVDIILPMFSRLITSIMNKQVNDIVKTQVPGFVNTITKKQKGLVNFGQWMDPKWNNSTFDYELVHLGFSDQQQLQVALNSTIFNSYTTGYRHVQGVEFPKEMPFYDENVNSTWQLFISTFLLEHLTATLLDESPMEVLVKWDMVGEPYLLTTDVAEAFWPFLTKEYGNAIPVDILVKILKIYNWQSNSTEQSITFNINVRAEGYLHIPDGSRKLVGSAEFYEGSLKIMLNFNDMNISGRINSTDFKYAYVETTYGIGRYESTSFTLNIVKFGALAAINGKKMLAGGFLVPANFSLLNIQDIYLGYFQDYILVGLTPHFKKAKKPIHPNKTLSSPPPIPVTTLYGNRTQQPVEIDKAIDHFAEKFITKLMAKFDEFEKQRREQQDEDFEKFEKMRDEDCEPGRCDYISRIIDEMEGIKPNKNEL